MCVADVAVLAKLVGVVPSPQSIVMDDIVPSGSAVENAMVTDWPVLAGLGETLVMLTVGALSFRVTEPEARPVEPLLSVTVIAIAKVWDLALPVLA